MRESDQKNACSGHQQAHPAGQGAIPPMDAIARHSVRLFNPETRACQPRPRAVLHQTHPGAGRRGVSVRVELPGAGVHEQDGVQPGESQGGE